MYLLKDVPRVGVKGEIVLMKPEAARHYFVPQQLAYYVPKEQGKSVLPDGWVPKIVSDEILQQILPADISITDESYLSTISLASAPQQTTPPKSLSTIQIVKLQNLAPLSFVRVPTRKGGREIFGSVSVNDIATALEDFGIKVDRSCIVSHVPRNGEIMGEENALPIKMIGTFSVSILTPAPIEIKISVGE